MSKKNKSSSKRKKAPVTPREEVSRKSKSKKPLPTSGNKPAPPREVTPEKSPKIILFILILSFVLPLLYYLVQGGIGFAEYGLSDEGFQWYGSIATAKGEVPIRDFHSYDPGRVYWTAAWSFLLGDGIRAFRLSKTFFQMIGIFFGLLTIRRMVTSWWGILLAGLFFIVWMHPRMKMFEYNIVLIGVFVAVWFLEKPSFKRHFVAGIFVGLAAFFGRNHGLYNFLAFFFLVLFAWHKGERSFLIKKGFLWGCGIVVGYSPMLFMIGVIPGFGDSFLRTVIAVAKYSNIKRAVPWPWTIDYTKLDWIMSFHKFGVGALFMLLPVFYVYSLITALRSSREEILARRVMIASSFIGLFYLHHAYNRGDWSYLTQSIHPFLVGIISVPCLFITDSSRKTARIVIVAVCFIMALVILPRDPLYKMSRDPEKFVYYDVAGDQIKMKKGTARMIRCMKKLNKKLFKEEDGFLIAPMWPGLYPLLDKPSPVWTLFFLRPATEEFQNTMIADMEKNNVKWIVIGNIAPEGKNENRFKNTHTVMWRHINANYSPVPDACVTKRNKKYTLYKKDGESFVIKNKRDEAKKAAAIKKIKKKKAPPPIIFFPDSMPRDSNPSRPGKAKPPE